MIYLSTNSTPVVARRFPLLSVVNTWLLLLPLLYFASMGSLWFQSEANNNALAYTYGTLASASNARDTIAIVVPIYVIVVLMALPLLPSIIVAAIREKLFLGLGVLATLSTLWSQFPITSLQWSIFTILCVVFAFFLHQRFEFQRLLQLTLLTGSVCLAFSFFLIATSPEYGIDHTLGTTAWKGMYSTKNTCADMTAFLLVGALYASKKSGFSRIFCSVYIVLSVFLILMTESSTGKILVACIFSFYFVLRMLTGMVNRHRALLLFFFISVITPAFAVLVSFWDELSYLLGKDPGLTGRTEIWVAALTSIGKRPLLGYGYMAFWRGYEGESANISVLTKWAVTHAHNGILEIWLTLGLVGVILVVLTFMRSIIDAGVCLVRYNSTAAQYFSCIVLLTIVYNFDEAALVTTGHLAWILYMVASISLSDIAKGEGMRLGGKS